MVDIAGKPIIQWELDALSEAKTVDHVIIVGLTEKSGLPAERKYLHPQPGKMVEHLQAGARKTLEITPKAKQVLMISSVYPSHYRRDGGVGGEQHHADQRRYLYHVIERAVMENAFRFQATWTRLKDMEVCGGDMNVARLQVIGQRRREIWDKNLEAARPPRAGGSDQFDTASLLIIGRLELEKAVGHVLGKRLKVAGRAVVCPYAGCGLDVNEPHQLEMVRRPRKNTPHTADRKTAAPKPSPSRLPGARNRGAPLYCKKDSEEIN